MNEVMTLKEIEAAFDGEWVLIEDTETTPTLEIIRGRVILHDKDKTLLHKKMKGLRPRSSAFLFVGEPPEDLVLTL